MVGGVADAITRRYRRQACRPNLLAHRSSPLMSGLPPRPVPLSSGTDRIQEIAGGRVGQPGGRRSEGSQRLTEYGRRRFSLAGEAWGQPTFRFLSFPRPPRPSETPNHTLSLLGRTVPRSVSQSLHGVHHTALAHQLGVLLERPNARSTHSCPSTDDRLHTPHHTLPAHSSTFVYIPLLTARQDPDSFAHQSSVSPAVASSRFSQFSPPRLRPPPSPHVIQTIAPPSSLSPLLRPSQHGRKSWNGFPSLRGELSLPFKYLFAVSDLSRRRAREG